MKNRFIYILILGLLLLLAAGCEGKKTEQPPVPPGGQETPWKEIIPDPGVTLYGWVADEDGKGIKDVVVTDGYSCALTDAEGVYQIVRHKDAIYVYISAPAGYEIPKQKGAGSYPGFYQSATPNTGIMHRADFVLTPRKGDFKKFTLFGIGDPQPNNPEKALLFRDETIADVRREIADISQPSVAIALGDIVGNNKGGRMFEIQKEYIGSMGIPCFVTIGNHDKSDGGKDHGEKFKGIFGPLYYSFNMGDVHFVCLDNVIFTNDPASPDREYVQGTTDEQVAWMEKDLQYISTDKMVILYYHIPMRNNTAAWGDKNRNTKKIMDLIKPYTNATTMCAHTHYFQPYHNSSGIFERIHGAACGYFWRSKCGGDGAPNGYVIYEIDGPRIVNSRFKATNRSADYQIRLYRGDATFPGKYKYTLGSDYVVANVFYSGMDGSGWTIKLYEDGVFSGNMKKMSQSVGDQWIRGYHVGVKGYSTGSAETPCHHQYQYKLKNPDAQVKVEASDAFGNVYYQTVFCDSQDYREAVGY